MGTKGNRKVKPPTILEAIPGSGGIISTIADTLGVEWHTAKKAIEENEEAKMALENEMEKRLDLAESVVIMNIQMAKNQQKNGKGYFADTSDAKWYVTRKGKRRGYGESVDVTTNGESIKPDNDGFKQSLSELSDALREIVSDKGTEKESKVDTKK